METNFLLNQNDHCSQCRETCEIRQIIKLYFSESQSAIEENITINDLEQKSLKLEEKSQKWERDLTAMKTCVLDKSVEINRVNKKCKKCWMTVSVTEPEFKGLLN